MCGSTAYRSERITGKDFKERKKNASACSDIHVADSQQKAQIEHKGHGNAQCKNNQRADSRYEDGERDEMGCCEGDRVRLRNAVKDGKRARTELGRDQDALEMRRNAQADDRASQDTHYKPNVSSGYGRWDECTLYSRYTTTRIVLKNEGRKDFLPLPVVKFSARTRSAPRWTRFGT